MCACLCLLLVCSGVRALESNVWGPYASKPSPPQKAELYFYSPTSDSLLFDKQKEIVLYCHAGLRSVGLRWTVARNMFKQPFLTGVAQAQPANLFIIRIPTAKLFPGFYDVRVLFNSGDVKEMDGICTFGYRVSEMPIRSSRPVDFEQFWANAKAELAKVPLAAEVRPLQTFGKKEIDAYNLEHASLPADYDPTGHRVEEVEAAKVSFAGVGGLRMYGWLAKPKGDGRFPALLVLPGAGFSARPIPLEQARHGYLAFDLQVHGQDVDLPGKYPLLPGYYTEPIFTPTSAYYYYRVYLNCIQAINYLVSRPDVDPTRIAIAGGSQGGRLSIVLAALDHRVAASVPAIAHNAYLPYLEWAKASNAAKPPQDGMDLPMPPALPAIPEHLCLAYYDILNFAPDVVCPVYMNVGLVDPVSPPSGVFAVYQRLGSKIKQITPLPGLGHDWSGEFDRRAWRWLDGQLKNRP
jgi:cephalosporin-C deacetylase-like acetyl esterase